MSAVVLIGALGTLLSTIQTLPHLAIALRTHTPSGSATGWALSLAGTTMWCLDGLLTHNFWLAAPTVVTFPVFSLLAFWCWRSITTAGHFDASDAGDAGAGDAGNAGDELGHARDVAIGPIDLIRDAPRRPTYAYRLDDTLELPRLLGV